MNQIKTPTAYRRYMLLYAILMMVGLFNTSQLQAQQCPVVQAFPVQDVPGFPQTDSLVLCGVPDTLALILFPSPTANYPNGLNVTFELPPGMQYGGFTGLSFPGPSISEADVSDVENPIFLIDNVGPGQIIALYIGVVGNCELVPPEDAPVNLVIDYVADLNGQLAACRDEIRPLAEYNSAYRIPVVNIIGGGPVVNGECVLTFNDFTTEYCDTLIISQDGIAAYIDSFNIFVEGLNLSPTGLNLERIEINDMPFPSGDFAYDVGTMSGQLTVTENFFPGNFDPNGMPTENDLDFNVNEQVTAVFCFTANDCASTDGQIVTFGATYSCFERQCFEPSEKEVAINFMPNFAPEPLIESGVIQTAEICGDNFIVEFEVSSDNANALEGLYQDLVVDFPVCPGLTPVAAEVFNWDSGTFVPLTEETATYNAATPPGDPGYDAVWTSDRDFASANELTFGFDGVTLDVDGANGGITDADNDGIFDDLPGDASFRVRFEFEFVCQAAEDAGCNALDCLLENAEVRGLRSCGQAFQQTGAGIIPAVEFTYGSDNVFSSAGPTENLSFGYQLQENVVGGPAGTVDRGEMGSVGTFNISHGYDFNQINLAPCPDGETKLVVDVAGSPALLGDLAYEAGTAMFWQGGVATPIPAGDVTVTPTIDPASGETTAFSLVLNVGTVSNPATVDSFTYNLQLDECYCTPRVGAITSKIVESCPGCSTGDCDVIKSCIDIQLRDDVSSCLDCGCVLPSQVVDMNRISTGFTDKSQTTRLDTSQTAEVDTRRFLPGDTMFIRSEHIINISDAEIAGLNEGIQFYISNIDVTYPSGIAKLGVLEQTLSQTPALWDGLASDVCGIFIQKGGMGPLTPVVFPNQEVRNLVGNDQAETCMFGTGVRLEGLGFPVLDASTTPPQNSFYHNFGSDDFYKGRDAIISIQAPCTQEFYALNNVESGDVFYVDWKMVLIKNPGQDPSLPAILPAVGAQTRMNFFDDDNPLLNRGANGSCLPPVPYEVHCPGPISVANDLTLTADGCNAILKQTYTLENPIPDAWYANEFRPIMGLAYADITVPPNLALCGGINILDETGAMLGTIPENLVSYPSMTEVMFGGQSYYIANPDSTSGFVRIEDAEFADGVPDQLYGYDGATYPQAVDGSGMSNAAYMDRFYNRDITNVGGTFPLLGVGIGDESCNFMLEYTFKRICQENVDPSTVSTVVAASYLESFAYGTSSEILPVKSGVEHESVNQGNRMFINLGNSDVGSTPEYINGQKVFDNGGNTNDASAPVQPVPVFPANWNSFWPYSADLFVNAYEYEFVSGQFMDANTGGDPTPLSICNIGVGRNPNNVLDTTMLVNFVDMSANFPSLTVSTDFTLIADAQDAPDCNFYEVCAGNDGGADLENMVTVIEVPQAVQLLTIMDQFGNGLAFTLINTTATTNVYEITHAGAGLVLSPGECYRMEICTELLFCPIGLDIPTNIDLSSSASCLAPTLTALLANEAEGSCLESGTSYEYISEEADLQVEFFIPEGMLEDIGLCEEICIAARVKNVKTSTLIGLNSIFVLPIGLEFVPGSWEVSYPGGPLQYGNGVSADMVDLQNCTDNAAWESIPDPNQVAPTRPRGTTYSYDWNNDLLGNSNGMLDPVIQNGFPGVSTMTAQNNLNNVAFRFRVRTICDEFTSGTFIRYLSTALDPCESPISSNLAITPPIIIEDANPADFAQLLTVADPSNINCGEMGNLNISTINTSMNNAVTLGARQCINIPTDGITYAPGSLVFLEPAGFDGMVTEEDIMGPDGMGGMTIVEKEICFNVPDNLGPGDFYQISFDFTLSQDVSCDRGEISVEISTTLEDQQCADTGISCEVGVLNSVNPIFAIDFLPPLDIENFVVQSACDEDPTMLVYSYMFDLENPGPDYMENVEIDIVRDLNQNGILDAFELDPTLNPMLGGPIIIPVNLPMGQSTTLMGEINVPADVGCPAFFRVRQNSECACDQTVTYINSAIPEFFADLGRDQVLCPGSPLLLNVCADYAPSAGNDYIFSNDNGTVTVNFMGNTVLTFNSDPIDGIDFSLMGDDLVATLNAGFGVDTPVDIDLTVNQGFCQEDYSVNVRSAPDLEIGPYNTQVVCSGDKQVLDLNLSAVLEQNATITWSPTTFLDDPTSPRPFICNPTSDIQYTVTVELNDSEMGCSGMAVYDVQVLDPGTIDLVYSGETICYDEMNPGILTATAGFTNYTFFVLVGGNEFIVQTGINNIYNLPGAGGTYFVRADDGSQCGLVSAPVSAPGLPCGECPDVYNGPSTLAICSGQLLDSIKVFTGSTAIDGIAFVIFDSQQLNPDDVYNYSSNGGSVLGSTTPMVMPPDTMATIYDVSVPAMPGDYYIYAILNPTPEQASCRPLEEILLTVNPLPLAGMTTDEACEDENGMASFVLSDYDSTIDIAGGNTVTYHLTQPNAEDNVNAIISNPYMTSVDITLYVRVETAAGCYSVGELALTANQLPLTPISGGDQSYCDGDMPPALFVQNPGTGLTVEWFTDATANTPVSGVTVGGFNNESITLNATSNPSLPSAGNSVTVFAQVRDDATNCVSTRRTAVTLINNPTPMASPAAMTVCEDEFQSRIGTFDLTSIVDDVNPDFMEGASATGGEFTSMNGMMVLSFHVSMSDADMDTNPISNVTNFMNTSLGSQTIFARVENEQGCFSIVQIQLSVAGQPDTDNLDLTVCPDIGSQNSRSGIDLTALEGVIASGNTPGSFSVTWFMDVTLTVNVPNPMNVTVMDGSTFYALIQFNAAPNCSNVAVVTYQVDPLPPIVDIILELCEDEALTGEVTNINLRDNDLNVAGGMSAIVNWYEDVNLTVSVPTPTNITLNMSGNSTEDNIFYAEVSDGDCTNRARVEYVIFQQAVPEAGGPYQICAMETVTLSGASLSGAATTAMWTITAMPAGGDGIVMPMGLSPSPGTATFTASVPGDYTLTLTTDDPAGPCPANMDETVVTVHPLPVANPATAQLCIGNTVDVDGMPTGGTPNYMTHQWTDLGNGTASGYTLVNTTSQVLTIDASGVAINAGAGTVNLEYTVTDNNGCMDTGTTTVIIHPLPIPNPQPAMVCVGDMVMVDGMPTQGTTPYMTHQWVDLGNGTASNYTLLGTDMQTVIVDASTTMSSEAGTVSLEYTVTDVNGCSQSETVTVTINPLPEITTMDGNITCEPPQQVQISVSTNASNPSYMWDGPGIVADGTTNMPTVNLPGVYTVTVTDGMTACMNTAQAFVTQDPLSKCLPATFEIKVKGGE